MSETDSRKALERLGLTSGEIDAYFSIVGKGVCLASEIAKKAHLPESDGLEICNKLVSAGLLKEIPGRTIRYQAIPPYSALLRQLEEFREHITDLRQKVPTELAEEFDRFETGFKRVSGLGDFKEFVLSVQEDIPKAMIQKLEEFAKKFESFQQLEEFKKFISDLKTSAPRDMAVRFDSLSGQFDKLSKMDEFRQFVAQIQDKATSELTTRFDKIETGFSEMQKLNEITYRFQEIREKVPNQLRSNFGSFQNEFQKVAGLEGFKEYVSTVRNALPTKIEMEFAQIEQQFTQLRQLQEFSQFVEQISTEVPQQTLREFEKFEDEFKKVSGLDEFKIFMQDLNENIPRELASQFTEFEQVLRGIKGELLNVNQDLFGNWQKIFGDIFEEFINAFVQDVVSEQLEKIKVIFEKEVINGVQRILSKVMARTETMSESVMDSFNNLRQWMVNEVISGLQQTLLSVNKKVNEASKGVTAGFSQLKAWITTQVTGDLQRTLSEVEDGATAASQQVMDSIANLQVWFDKTVVLQLTTILSGMEQKLQKAVQDAQSELQNVKGWFVKDAIEGISQTLKATQDSVERVSVEVNAALVKLKEWFAGEAINQLGMALSEVESRIGQASSDVVTGFNEMENWVANDVVKTIENTLADVTVKVSSASDAIMEEVTSLREMFSSRVVNNTFNMLSGIEERLWESEATMKAFWDKAIAEISFRFQEVWFVQGADAMIGEIAQVCERVKSKLFIVAPSLEDVDIVPLRLVPNKVNIRIASLIDPNSEKTMQILEEFIDKPNFRFRNYTGENIWGCSKDFEEIILGAVSSNDVAGIGSIIEEHIKNFNPVLEHAWMDGRPIKSLEEAKLIKVKRLPKKLINVGTNAPSSPSQKIESNPISASVSSPKSYPSINNPGTEFAAAKQSPQEILNKVQNLGHQVIEKQTLNKADENEISISKIDAAFRSSKSRMKEELKQKLNQIQENLPSLNKETLGNILEELKEFTVQKYGFSRIVFEMSKTSREYRKKPKDYLSSEEKVNLEYKFKEWVK